MERIKQALEKAREQRSNSEYAVDRVGTGAAPVPKMPAASDPSIERMRQPVVTLNPSHLERHRIIAHSKDNPLSESFDLLRTKLLHKMASAGYRTLGIVAPSPSVGKSVLSINLAMSIARLPETSALLVDFDLRSPNVINYLGLEQDRSMTDFLQDRCEFEEVLAYPQLPGFIVAGANQPVPNSAEVLTSKKVGRFVEDAKNRYSDRIVIFDLPPLLCGDDTIAVLPRIDCVLLVLACGMSSRTDVEEAMKLLKGFNLLGTVLNKAPRNSDYFNYGYRN